MDIKKILKIKGLKYWVATAVFLVVILFIDTNNLLVTMRLHREVKELEEKCSKLEAEIQKESEVKQNYDDIEAKERYGREVYHMKRENEDIYTRR